MPRAKKNVAEEAVEKVKAVAEEAKESVKAAAETAVEKAEEKVEEVSAMLQKEMEGEAPELPIKLAVEVTTGKNWGEL